MGPSFLVYLICFYAERLIVQGLLFSSGALVVATSPVISAVVMFIIA